MTQHTKTLNQLVSNYYTIYKGFLIEEHLGKFYFGQIKRHEFQSLESAKAKIDSIIEAFHKK